jgi:hypothetical protein
LQEELQKYEKLITASESYEDNPKRRIVAPQMTNQMKWDLFICHASEDKKEVAEPLAKMLQAQNLEVWYDNFTLTVGDSLRRRIDEGLANSRYGVVILSPSFFTKNWPQKELDGLAAREDAEGHKVILPVWHNVDQKYVARYSPTLADRLATETSDGLKVVLSDLLKAISQPSETLTPTPVAVSKPAITAIANQRDLDLDNDIIQMFSRFKSELTDSHVKVLEFLDGPNEFGKRHNVKYGSYAGGSPSHLLEEAIPQLGGRREFYDQIVRDLYSRGLINTDANGMHAMMTSNGMFARRTSEIGHNFLKFIKERLDVTR